ncbi:unnamed protein product, partial [Phaeothamnion confervicola]
RSCKKRPRSKQASSFLFHTHSYDTMESLERFNTGDIILFSRPCLRFGVVGATICTATKLLHSTPWDHVGVVVVTADGERLLLEAAFSGVVVRSLAERLKRSGALRITVRHLEVHRGEAFCDAARAFLAEVTGQPYNSTFSLLLAAINFHPLKNERRRLHGELGAVEADIASLENDLLPASEAAPSSAGRPCGS